MASAGSLLSEDQFLCSICLGVFTDPITTACGHNYCKTCITHYWDTSEVCQCPLCDETFYQRPKFSVNKVLSEMADHFRKSKQLTKTSNANQEPAKPGEVSCDICTETKLKALKSCLVCLISYCETHLEPHQRLAQLKRHKLIDPVKNLEDCMCKKHDRPLELFCKTDHVCVCKLCTELDHKSHQIVSLEEECEGQKAEVQQMIQQRQEKIEEVKQSAELSKKDADREIADGVQVFTALMSCTERSQAELVDVIEENKKTTQKQAEGFIKELEREITELKKRSSELKQLSHTEDHLHLLQNFTSINTPLPTKDWTKVNVRQSSYVGTVRTAVAQLEKTLSQEMEKLYDAELRSIRQYAMDATHSVFVNNSVFGNKSFSSGRFYYEVQVKGYTDWYLGVARESVDQWATHIKRNPNNGHWTIALRWGKIFKARAGPSVLLPVREGIQTVGVFVDYEEGLVSFYDVEARAHLYSFTGCTFIQTLYPYLKILLLGWK